MTSTRFFTIPIGDFSDGLKTLPYAADSAKLLHEYVSKHWPGDLGNFRLPSDQKTSWTQAEVRSYLRDGLSAVDPADDVVIYWAGHADGDPLRLHLSKGGWIHADDLADWMLNSPAQSIVLLLDCCYSGNGVDDLLEHFLRKERTELTADGRSVSVIASASPGQLSTEILFVTTVVESLRFGPPGALAKKHAWLAEQDAVTPEQLAAAANAYLRHLGATQRTRSRVLLGSPGRVVPRARDRLAPAWAPASRLTRDVHRAAELVGLVWPGELSELALKAIEHGKRRISDPVILSYLDCVVQGARLAVSLDQELRELLPPIPSETFDAELRRAYYAGTGVWLDFEWGSTLDYAYGITQRVTDRSRASVVRSLLVFALRLLQESQVKLRSGAIFQWALAHGISPVAFSAAQREARKELGETRLIIEFDPSGRFSQLAPPIGLRAQLWAEESFLGDSIELPFDGGTPEAAVARLLSKPQLKGAFDAVDLVLPASLLLFDTRTTRILDAMGYPVPIDRVVRIHRRFSERLWNRQSVMSAQGMYSDIVASADNVILIQPGETSASDLYYHLRDRRVGAALVTADASAFMETLLSCVRASPITVWPTVEGTDVPSALHDYWPSVPEAIRNGRSVPEDPRWATGASLLCVWDDPFWLSIADRICAYDNAYDEEGFA